MGFRENCRLRLRALLPFKHRAAVIAGGACAGYREGCAAGGAFNFVDFTTTGHEVISLSKGDVVRDHSHHVSRITHHLIAAPGIPKEPRFHYGSLKEFYLRVNRHTGLIPRFGGLAQGDEALWFPIGGQGHSFSDEVRYKQRGANPAGSQAFGVGQ